MQLLSNWQTLLFKSISFAQIFVTFVYICLLLFTFSCLKSKISIQVHIKVFNVQFFGDFQVLSVLQMLYHTFDNHEVSLSDEQFKHDL